MRSTGLKCFVSVICIFLVIFQSYIDVGIILTFVADVEVSFYLRFP